MKILYSKFRYVLFLYVLLQFAVSLHADLTLPMCLEKASKNYPLLRKFNILDASKEIELSEINNSWLPGLGVYAQGTIQNVVPSFPSQLTGIMNQMGQSIKGLDKFQYKIGAELNQSIWDGGVSKARRECVIAADEVQKASLEVEIYSIRQRVENIYFAILLIESQIERNKETISLINSNIERLSSMAKNGVALQSDVDMLEAQNISIKQAVIEAEAADKGYRRMLEIFIGEPVENEKLILPDEGIIHDGVSRRPELTLLDKRMESSLAMKKLADSSIMPKINLFAQAYYGYPGYDYFKSMMNRDLSFNIMAGVKVSWALNSLYNRKNTSAKYKSSCQEADLDREVFLFNSKIQESLEIENINGLREMMKDDAKIIKLRTNVRKTAESQLRNGVVDATALLTKITDENIAYLNAKFHEIKLLQEIYKLKNTLNDYE